MMTSIVHLSFNRSYARTNQNARITWVIILFSIHNILIAILVAGQKDRDLYKKRCPPFESNLKKNLQIDWFLAWQDSFMKRYRPYLRNTLSSVIAFRRFQVKIDKKIHKACESYIIKCVGQIKQGYISVIFTFMIIQKDARNKWLYLFYFLL